MSVYSRVTLVALVILASAASGCAPSASDLAGEYALVEASTASQSFLAGKDGSGELILYPGGSLRGRAVIGKDGVQIQGGWYLADGTMMLRLDTDEGDLLVPPIPYSTIEAIQGRRGELSFRLPRPARRSAAYETGMRFDLRNLASAQRFYRQENGRYATSLAQFPIQIRPLRGNRISFSASGTSFSATARHDSLPHVVCTLGVATDEATCASSPYDTAFVQLVWQKLK